jgi:hypothetical protein
MASGRTPEPPAIHIRRAVDRLLRSGHDEPCLAGSSSFSSSTVGRLSFPDADRSRFSPAGEMESVADFARGANANPRKKRLVRVVLFVIFVVPVAVALLIGLLTVLLGD